MYTHVKTFNYIIVEGGTVCKQACGSYTLKIIPEILLLINTTIFYHCFTKGWKEHETKNYHKLSKNYVYKTMMYSV